MLETIVVIILLAVVAVVAYAAMQPNDFRLERSQAIAASPQTILGHIEDFRKWRQWSPWEGLDPNLERDYSGAERGKGAVYAWRGNGKAGQGRMEILEADPRHVRIALDFIKPFKASNIAEFTLTPAGDATRVNWAMTGSRSLMMKVMGLVFDMEKMVGPDFERGLASLKQAAEAG